MVLLDEGGRGRPHTRLISPVANLSIWVEHFWIQEGYGPSPNRPWRILPDSSPHLIFSIERGSPQGASASFGIVGARSIYRDIDVTSRTTTVGARLKAGALFELTGLRADIFTDCAFCCGGCFWAHGQTVGGPHEAGQPRGCIGSFEGVSGKSPGAFPESSSVP
jgi:hypothetical protein